MPSTRVRGEDTELLITVDGKAQTALVDVRSFEMSAQLEILAEGYLGESTDRRDEVYKGVKGSLELHFEDSAVFSFMRTIINRARRKTPGVQVNIKTTLNMPNGQRPKILIEDAYFGEMPLSFGSRADYGSITLNFEAADFDVL